MLPNQRTQITAIGLGVSIVSTRVRTITSVIISRDIYHDSLVILTSEDILKISTKISNCFLTNNLLTLVFYPMSGLQALGAENCTDGGDYFVCLNCESDDDL